MQRQLEGLQRVLATLPKHLPVLEEAAKALVAALTAGHKLLACGNGGSCAEAQHLVTELLGRYDRDRISLPAIYLGADAGLMSCIVNDYSFAHTFTRPLQALGRRGDILICFTTSGNSSNVVEALTLANQLGIRSLALLGKGGGPCRGLATWEVIIDSNETARVQEAHLFILHWLCDQLDEAFCG